MKTAIIHDWFVTYAGSERVVEQIIQLYPDADVHSLVDFVPAEERGFLLNKKIATTFIQQLPKAQRKFRAYLPLFPLAVEQFDFSQYDLVISSSHAVAKGAKTDQAQTHICYCHTPIRYVWDLRQQYLKESGLDRGVRGWLTNTMLNRLQKWDAATAGRPDFYIANSCYIAERIKRIYNRDAAVIYPPVDVGRYTLASKKEEFYLAASRMVPYKKMDLIAEAFSSMPDKKLVVIGDGPDYVKVKAKSGKNIEILGYQPFPVLRDYMQRAKAFVFAAEEDFGIVPVEAQACGTPVIAFGRGGALETVIGLPDSKAVIASMCSPTGVFFQEQSVDSLKKAILLFEKNNDKFDGQRLRENAIKFSVDRFKREFKAFVDSRIAEKKGSFREV